MAAMVEESTGWIRPDWAEWPEEPSQAFIQEEFIKCFKSPAYFINNYVSIYAAADKPPDDDEEEYDPTAAGGQWIRFVLWPAQRVPLDIMHKRRKSIHLKARQIGLTWLALAYVLWMLIFLDRTTALLFSRRDTEAMDLMRRLKDMFRRLPWWFQPSESYDRKGNLTGASGHQWTLPDGSRVMAFPTSAGDSYSASIAVVDEADLVPDLDRLMSSVKPTVDGGGKLILISRVDKKKPESPFKRMYRAARAGLTGFASVFLPWYSHPGRTMGWYRAQKSESLGRTFSLDYLYEQYPATDEQALAPNQLDKRFPTSSLSPCFKPAVDLCKGGEVRPRVEWLNPKWKEDGSAFKKVDCPDCVLKGIFDKKDCKTCKGQKTLLEPEPKTIEVVCPDIKGLVLYKLPAADLVTTIGVDPALGLPGGDDSALVIVDDAGEEVGKVVGKIAPRAVGRISAELCNFFRAPPSARCTVVIERNNHGVSVISWWRDNVDRDRLDASLWRGPDKEPGWAQTAVRKELMYHRCSDRVSRKECIIHSQDVFDQIANVEASTLEAPEGQHDDIAVAWGLALAVISLKKKLNWLDSLKG